MHCKHALQTWLFLLDDLFPPLPCQAPAAADNTNHFFRVDRGFVAQTADINGGRTAPMSPLQQARRKEHAALPPPCWLMALANLTSLLCPFRAPLGLLMQAVASRNVPLEVHTDLKHSKRGILSMARGDGEREGPSQDQGCCV